VSIWPILAAAATSPPNLKDLPDYSRGSRLAVNDMALVFGLIGLVVAALVIWAWFIRGPKKHPDEAHQPNLQPAKPSVTVTDDGRERHRKKKRVRRRDHRLRNPTLDQVGGLPPPRDPQESTSV
jgi:hypothetical protein